MALWVCECGTKYSVGAPACPHCGSTKYYEDGAEDGAPVISVPSVDKPPEEAVSLPATPPLDSAVTPAAGRSGGRSGKAK